MCGGDGMALSLQSFVNTGRSSHATSSARMPALATTAMTSIVQSAIACDSRQRPRHAETARWCFELPVNSSGRLQGSSTAPILQLPILQFLEIKAAVV